MKRFAQLLTIALLLVTLVIPMSSRPSLATSTYAPSHQRVLIEFQPGRRVAARNMLAQSGGEIHYEFDNINTIAVTLPSAALEGIRRNPNVVLVEEDVLRSPMGQDIPWGIDAVQARDVWDADRNGLVDAGAPTGAGITVCVIDSGLYTGHEDFAGVNVIGGHPIGWNSDTCGHGTHVAGSIAAANNNVGVVGVSPGAVSFYIVKVFDGASCGWSYSSDLVNAVNQCASAGANIISMSLGGGGKSKTEERAFQTLYNQGILSIAAAGNDGTTALSYPASYASVVSVAAIDSNYVVADFSQKNSAVEVAAPGVAVLSTVPWDATTEVVLDGVTYAANHVENAAYGAANGALVYGGLCDSTGSWSGKVVICERGSISFFDKVRNVQNSGGVAAIIYNNEPGDLSATLGDGNASTIPAIGLSQAAGQYLVANKLNLPAQVTSTIIQPGNGYEAWNGTSMATPHVSGVAALVWSANPSWTNVQIRQALTSTALDLGAVGRDNSYGYGLVQAYDALVSLGWSGGGGGGENTPPVASFAFTCTDLACAFNASASYDLDGSLVSYAWNFGDGTTGSGVTANRTYAAAGSFNVTLTVTDNEGATGNASQTVAVTSGGGGGDEDITPPVISNVTSVKSGNINYIISWTTNEPATTEVIMGGTTYVDNTLTTSHSMTFRGKKGTTYTYYVQSTDASGNTAIAGPFTHNN